MTRDSPSKGIYLALYVELFDLIYSVMHAEKYATIEKSIDYMPCVQAKVLLRSFYDGSPRKWTT